MYVYITSQISSLKRKGPLSLSLSKLMGHSHTGKAKVGPTYQGFAPLSLVTKFKGLVDSFVVSFTLLIANDRVSFLKCFSLC